MKLSKNKIIVFFLYFLSSFLYGQQSATHTVNIRIRRTNQFFVNTQRAEKNTDQHGFYNPANLNFQVKMINNHKDDVSICICEKESDFSYAYNGINPHNCGDSQLNNISLDEIIEAYRNLHNPMTENPLNIKMLVFTMTDS